MERKAKKKTAAAKPGPNKRRRARGSVLISHSARFYNNDPQAKLGRLASLGSSLFIASCESVALTTPCEMLKVRHMTEPVHVPFRKVIYDCFFASPPIFVRARRSWLIISL